MSIEFACISPHPPILLPSVGKEKEKMKVKETIRSLKKLEEMLTKSRAEEIIISSPHPDWGFNVPLFFIAKDFKGKIKKYLTGTKEPCFYFEQGKKIAKEMKNKKYALIASGDLSHRLKEDGPYGFHSQGPKFDEALISYLKKKEIEKIKKLDEEFPEAGECGLRSICFLLGILENSEIEWQPKILSYQKPFGVGYLVTNFKITCIH
jgi:aromatic ring-opening dioxygenase LigB subunit